MSTPLNPLHRSASLDFLASFELDVLVVGGGVVGAGTALDAVTRGLRPGSSSSATSPAAPAAAAAS